MCALSPGAVGMNKGSKPAHAETCTLPVICAGRFSEFFPGPLGEYWYHTAGGC